MAALRKQVEDYDIHRWIFAILGVMLHLTRSGSGDSRSVLDHREEIKERIQERAVFLILDDDGTLTAIVDALEQANLSAAMRNRIGCLQRKVPVVIGSG